MVLSGEAVEALFQAVAAEEGYSLTVDLPQQQVQRPDGAALPFEVDPFRKRCLLEGLDDIGLTLEDAPLIRDFESRWRRTAPWYFTALSPSPSGQ